MNTEIIILVPVICSFTMLISGFLAYRRPLAWEKRTTAVRYPRFDNLDATVNKGYWYFAQHTYGKALLIAGAANAVVSALLGGIVAGNLTKWFQGNPTLPGVLIFCVPATIFALGANKYTEIRLGKRLGY